MPLKIGKCRKVIFLGTQRPDGGSALFNYPTYDGPGGANEGYEAIDFQNMPLAVQTVTPRAQVRGHIAGNVLDR